MQSEIEVMAKDPKRAKVRTRKEARSKCGPMLEGCAEKEDWLLKRVADPRKPTEQEDHVPYRVKAKGKDLDHRKAVDGERGLNEYSFDYSFPGAELGYRLTVLVGHERTSGMTMATVIPSKGGSGKFMTDRVMKSNEE